MFACVLSSCHSKSGMKKSSAEENWHTFENEYISIKYPDDYFEVGDFEVGVDNFQHYATDSTAENSIDILPCDSTKDDPWLHVVLSRCAFQLPLRDFMNTSIGSKGMMGEDVELASDVDSTTFAGYPALSVTFAYPQENGDTLLQWQTIVQLPDYKLYYINVGCYSKYVNDSERLVPVFKMLETFKFK